MAEPTRLRVMDVTQSDVDGGVLTFKGWLPRVENTMDREDSVAVKHSPKKIII